MNTCFLNRTLHPYKSTISSLFIIRTIRKTKRIIQNGWFGSYVNFIHGENYTTKHVKEQ